MLMASLNVYYLSDNVNKFFTAWQNLKILVLNIFFKEILVLHLILEDQEIVRNTDKKEDCIP